MVEISVILPVYNVEKWIDRCLESIISQTIGLDAFEIICVDDCSTDATVTKLLAWEARFPENVMVVRCQKNARQGAARNIGLEYAGGEWIAFIDSDDWIEPDYLEKLYKAAVSGKYELVCCGHKRDFSKSYTFFDRTDFSDQGYEIQILDEESRRSYIMNPKAGYSAWAKIIKKDFLKDNELYFPENLTYEDACWGSILSLYLKHAFVLEDPLYHYFVNDTSMVLKNNSNHHLDCLTVQTICWREYERRGFLQKYREELEIEHIYSAYLAGFKMLVLRYEVPDYNVYLLLRELMLDRIGDYRNNPYIKRNTCREVYADTWSS